jgi:hypothetical protein
MKFQTKLQELELLLKAWSKKYDELSNQPPQAKHFTKQEQFLKVYLVLQEFFKIQKLESEEDLDKENNSKIVPICIRYLQYTDFCGDIYTQLELLSAGEYGGLGVPLNLATMFVRFETWQLDSENKPVLNNVSNRIPPLPAGDIIVLTTLIGRYNNFNGQIQSNCQFRNLSDVDGWGSQKMIARQASGPWYIVQIANVSVPPILTIRFGINQVNLTNNTLMNAAQIAINQLVTVNILATFRQCGDLPAFITINLPGLDNAGLAIAVATQTAIGANIQAQILNDMSNSNIPTAGITFATTPNAVPFPSIVITSP